MLTHPISALSTARSCNGSNVVPSVFLSELNVRAPSLGARRAECDNREAMAAWVGPNAALERALR